MRCPLRRPSLARPAAALARGWLPPPPARAPDENFRVLLSPNKSEINQHCGVGERRSLALLWALRADLLYCGAALHELVPAAMLIAAALLAFAPGERLKVGDPAPDFSATSHTGATVTLKDYAGKRLILWFYPRAGTGG